MKILIDLLHPAHVHFFRAFAKEMQDRGHEVLLAARHKDVTLRLLERYGLPYELLSRQGATVMGLAAELAVRTGRLVRLARRFQPDHLVGIMGPVIALAGRMLPARVTVFYDNESARKVNRFAYALADAYLTPRAFRDDYGPKQHRYCGYHELAYLHPNRFTPDEGVVQGYGLAADQPYSVVRFVSWQSIHDVGESGFSHRGKRDLVELLAAHGRVLISSEAPLPPDLEPFRLRISVEDIHHVLAFARLVVGESSTMASEACVLGTHAVYVSRTGRGVNDEQEERYGLSRYFTSGREQEVLAHVRALLGRDDLDRDAQSRRDRLLSENVDVTQMLVRYFESEGRDLAGAPSGQGR